MGVIMLNKALTLGFLVYKSLALDCSDPTTEKFTLRDTTENIKWDWQSGADFSDTGFALLLRSAVAYAFQELPNPIDIQPENVSIRNATTRINGCIVVENQSTEAIQNALTESQKKVYEI